MMNLSYFVSGIGRKIFPMKTLSRFHIAAMVRRGNLTTR
jgi:hypothetical protein